MKQVFLSYCHANREQANQIDKDLKPLLSFAGYRLIRDIRDMDYKDKIDKFMQLVREADYVLMLISDDFLKSANCMYEMLEVAKDNDFEDKILPLVIGDTEFYSPEGKVEYIRYWNDKRDELEAQLNGLPLESLSTSSKDLKHYRNICNGIGEFLSLLTKMKWKSFEEMAAEQYKSIFKYIGVPQPDLWQELIRIEQIENLEDRELALIAFLGKDHDNPFGQYAYGNLRANQKKWKLALQRYEKSVEHAPGFSWAWNGKGIVLWKFGKHEEALEAFEKAIQLDSEFAEPWNGKGNVLYDLGKHREALAAFEQAIKIDPEYAAPWNGKGNALKDLGKHREALTAYEQAIKIDPEYAAPWSGKGNVLHSLGKHSEALAAYKQAIKIDSTVAIPWNGKGNALNDLGKHREALTAYEQAIKIDPTNVAPWNGKGNALDDLGKHREALAAYEKAIKIDPSNGGFWYNKALLLAKMGQPEAAEEARQQARKLGFER
ncbi:MAG: tetratricopeptide repeat protein [Candidatus Cloacimonetes bacterium]|nr:tetratricopeptide repeat protein [Candidatus Cloacimonadota bacterium]